MKPQSFLEVQILKKLSIKLKRLPLDFAITRGSKGALIFDGEHYHHVEAPKVVPIDSTGAGDLFAGTFLYSITHGKNFHQAGTLACKAASRLVTQYGARLTKEQIRELASN